MKALKVLIIVMSVLILAGFGIIAVTLYKRMTAPEEAQAPAAEKAAPKAARLPAVEIPGAPPPAFGTARLGLPAGSEVIEMRAEGRRLLLRVRLPDGGQWIHVVDLATGASLGRIELTPGR